MVKISTRSWHFRWMQHLGLHANYSYSICPYFWKLSSVTWIPLLIASVFVAINVHFPVVFETWITFVIGVLAWTLVITGAVLYFAALLAVIASFLTGMSIKDFWNNESLRVRPGVENFFTSTSSGIGVVYHFAKAKKSQVCPLIEYEYE